MQKILQKIQTLKTQIDHLRPLNAGELRELKKWYDLTYTFNSNAIEGNSLTLEETRLVLEDGLTIQGKPMREIFEAVNHKKSIDAIYDLIQNKTELTEKIVLDIHKIILQNIDEENAGIYRRIQVYISGEILLPPKSQEVPHLMQALFQWFEKASAEKENPLYLSAKWHYDFVKIHPFTDGNGRTARLIGNLILLKFGYPLQIIPVIRRAEYISSLKSTQKFEDFYQFFLDIQHENMKDYLRMIGSV